jgi:uncharacterized protein (TIGR03067 family)
MRSLALMTLAAALTLAGQGLARAADDASGDAIRKELKELDGTWQLLTMMADGKELTQITAQHRSTAIRGGRLTAGGDSETAMVLKPITGTNPKAIDLIILAGEGKGQSFTGIYKREGEFLTICFAPAGKDRPTEFASKAGSGRTLMVYQRQQPTRAEQAPAGVPRWEYRIINAAEVARLGQDELTAGLNLLGDGGWELVLVEQPGSGRSPLYYFKRPKPGGGRAEAPAAPPPAPAEVFVIRLKNAKAADLAKIVTAVFGDGRNSVVIVADPATNSLVVRGTEEKLREVQALVERLDTQAIDR